VNSIIAEDFEREDDYDDEEQRGIKTPEPINSDEKRQLVLASNLSSSSLFHIKNPTKRRKDVQAKIDSYKPYLQKIDPRQALLQEALMA
jgi:hypothetical protein